MQTFRLARIQMACPLTVVFALQEGGTWVVMFYAPWCGHCMESKPAFEQAALEYAQAAALADYHRAQQGMAPGGFQEVQFAMLDGDHYSNIIKHEGIRGFPTTRLYSGGRMVRDYKGDRSVEDFLSFAAGVPQGAHHEAETLDAQCKMAYGAGSEFDGEMCDCRPGFKNVDGRCVPIEKPKRKARAPTKVTINAFMLRHACPLVNLFARYGSGSLQVRIGFRFLLFLQCPHSLDDADS